MAESWHQAQARKRAWRTRNLPAHIMKAGRFDPYESLCGVPHPQVTVDPEHASKPENKTCKRCMKILRDG